MMGEGGGWAAIAMAATGVAHNLLVVTLLFMLHLQRKIKMRSASLSWKVGR